MGRALVIIRSKADRVRIAQWAAAAPQGTRVEFKASKRSLPQNARMWAMLTEVVRQGPRYHGVKLSPDDWRLLFLDQLRRDVRIVPNLDGNGFVNLGRSTSDLSKEEMSNLFIEIEKYCAEHGVTLKDDRGGI